jgi:hypothetical protein
VNPTLVLMAVRAALRLGRAGQQAFGQYARDRDAMLPLLNIVQFPKRDLVRGFFEINPDLISSDLRGYWESFIRKQGARRLAGDFDVVAAEYVRLQALEDAKVKPLADEFAGLWMVQQWSRGEEPPGPVARVVLTIVDVAAEFAAHDPTLFGVGGNAEVLVKALATRVADLVPDTADALGPRNLLGERLAGLFLKAGLGALSEHPEAIVEDAHLQRLVASTLPKLVESLPATLDKQVKWRNVVESLLGPVASEAMRTVVENPQAFFGGKFGDDDLLGALTRTYLLKAADVGLQDVLTKAGAVQLYKATVQLAAARPELFIGKADDASEEFVAAVFHDLALTLELSVGPLDRQLIATLAATTIETAAREGASLLDPGKPWRNVVSQTLTPVVAALAEALRAGESGALMRLRSGANVEAMVRIVVAQMARTPGMITSTDNIEVNRLVSAIAGAMAKDEHLLLSHEDWMGILAIAAQEVAANPGRLVGVTGSGAAASLLATLLSDLLFVASEQWKQNGRAGGTVLFGATLREAMLITIRATAGQSAAALLNAAKVKELAAQLTELVATKAGRYGSKEWLCLYRALIMQVVESGSVAQLDEATIDAALAAAGVNP